MNKGTDQIHLWLWTVLTKKEAELPLLSAALARDPLHPIIHQTEL